MLTEGRTSTFDGNRVTARCGLTLTEPGEGTVPRRRSGGSTWGAPLPVANLGDGSLSMFCWPTTPLRPFGRCQEDHGTSKGPIWRHYFGLPLNLGMRASAWWLQGQCRLDRARPVRSRPTIAGLCLVQSLFRPANRRLQRRGQVDAVRLSATCTRAILPPSPPRLEARLGRLAGRPSPRPFARPLRLVRDSL